MEQRINLITLGVSNLSRSRSFYEQGLGWKCAWTDNNDVAFYQMGGIILSLFEASALAKDAGLPGPQKSAGFSIAYNTRSKEEVDSFLAKAEAAGATITQPAHEAFWGGYTGYFADPDGHAWEVAWNPGWEVREDGSVDMKLK